MRKKKEQKEQKKSRRSHRGSCHGTGCPNYDLISQSLAKIMIRTLQLLVKSDLWAMAVND